MIVFIAVLLIWIFSLCLHEYAHARVAYAGGDESVAHKGYLDFNPLRYLDVMTSLVFPIILLLLGGIPLPGGAVWIDRSRLRSRGWVTAVSLAGPLANVVVAIACAAPFALGFVDGDSTHPAWAILAFCTYLQFTAAIFNLLPVPGLDGYGAIEPWLPYAVQDAIQPYRRYAIFGLLILSMGTGFGKWIFLTALGGLKALGVPPEFLRDGYLAFFFWQ